MSPKIAEFHRLHQSGCFVMPNPWDRGSAIYLQKLGFKALATTSAGFAFTLGRLDGQVTLDELVDHVRFIDAATSLPLTSSSATRDSGTPTARSTWASLRWALRGRGGPQDLRR